MVQRDALLYSIIVIYLSIYNTHQNLGSKHLVHHIDRILVSLYSMMMSCKVNVTKPDELTHVE